MLEITTDELIDIAYDKIKESELWDLLPSNDAIDKCAEVLAGEVEEFLNERIAARVAQETRQ